MKIRMPAVKSSCDEITRTADRLYNETEILSLYVSVDWTAYTDQAEMLKKGFEHVRQIELATDDTPQTIAFYEAHGFRKMSDIGCCALIRI